MTNEQFVYWLQGFMELNTEPLTKREQMIKDHLQTVFHKVTPPNPYQNRDLIGKPVGTIEPNRDFLNQPIC